MKRFLSLIVCLCVIVSLSSCLRKPAEANPETSNEHNTLDFYTTEKEYVYNTLPAQSTSIEQTTTDFNHNNELSDAEYDRICGKYDATGVQVAVIKNGKMFDTYEYGVARKDGNIPVTADTKYRVASLSKLVTDIVFMRLCEDGLLDLNADISNYLGFKVRNPRYPESVITPAMLMSHTSSIVDSQKFLSSRLSSSSERIENLLERNDSYSYSKPGTEFSYSNFSVALIGSICEKTTGKAFDTLAHEYIFNPMGIDASYLIFSCF